MKRLRYRRAIADALREELSRDPAVFLIGEDLRDPWGGTYKATQGLSTEFGDERILNTPIAEGGLVGVALGAALRGLRPVVELMYLDFALLASDQLVNQVAKIRYMTGGQATVPITIRTQGGGYKSSAAQHGQSLEAWFAHVPGLLVAMPSDAADAKGLLKTAIRLDDPVLFIEHKSLYTEIGDVPEGEHLVPLGEAALKRNGSDVAIVAWSKAVGLSLKAAEVLAAEHGIEASVLDLRTLVPLDRAAILDAAARTRRVVVVHEAHRFGGFGAEIASLITEELFETLEAPVTRVGALHVPLPMAPNLEHYVLPSVERIIAQVLRTVGSGPVGTTQVAV